MPVWANNKAKVSGKVLQKSVNLPYFAIDTESVSTPGYKVKRVLDFFASSVGLLVLFFPLFGVALLVKLTSRGDVFYSQERIGQDGHKFRIYKFRTMVMNAESDGKARIATHDDDRTTTVGKVLRRCSIDELPQLWNVMRGDMSLVGPRPEREVYVNSYQSQFSRYQDRHKVRGGLTGLAQVKGYRGNTCIKERTRYDVQYVDSCSLVRDAKIILKTFGAVINSKEAY